MSVMKHYGKKHTNDNDNDSREQPYLMPGAPAYEQRQEDLQMHDPFRPDDEWHNEREVMNQSHASLMQKKHEKSKGNSPTGNLQYRHRMAKEDQYKEVKHEAMDLALTTETKEDDKIAESINRRGLEDLVFDEGISEDEYVPAAIKKYMD